MKPRRGGAQRLGFDPELERRRITIRTRGRRLTLTDPDRVLFPDDGTTKRDLFAHYRAVATAMLPYARGRPLAVRRFPLGIQRRGFWQRTLQDPPPPGLDTVRLQDARGRQGEHLLVTERTGLLFLAQLNALEVHGASHPVQHPTRPDRLVFQLQPSGRANFDTVRGAALHLRELLEDLDLPPYVMTDGEDALHVWVPMDTEADYRAARPFAREVAQALARRHPDTCTADLRADPGDRVTVDASRNSPTAVTLLPYSPRARRGAPVAMPITWERLLDRRWRPKHATLHNAASVLVRSGDPWRGLLRRTGSLVHAQQRLQELQLGQSPRRTSAAKAFVGGGPRRRRRLRTAPRRRSQTRAAGAPVGRSGAGRAARRLRP
jgi:bifunctional non-homologous end joining protein LigD